MKTAARRSSADAIADTRHAPMQMRMDCPDCASGIELSLPSLLAARPVWCSGCGARFDINLASSAEVLHKVSQGLDQLRSVRDDAAGMARD